MDWTASTAWWALAGVLVAAELASGTFYLLMLALGVAAAAIAAQAGLAVSAQLVVAAAIGGGAVAAWHLRRSKRSASAPARSNPDVNIDIGEHVHVSQWSTDGSATVHYRGCDWQARWQGSGAPVAGDCVIRAIDGNRLMLESS